MRRAMVTGRWSLILAVLGAALLVTGVVVSAQGSPRPADAGTVPLSVLGDLGPMASPAGTPETGLPAAEVPVALALPGRGVTTIVPEGLTAGALNLPQAVSQLGWWTGGAGLSSDHGSLVVAGHVDSAEQGVGYFAALRDVPLGSDVVLRGKDGADHRFQVVGRRSYPKAQPLPASLFAQDVTTRVVLITCTGAFEETTHSYADTLVVYGVPVS